MSVREKDNPELFTKIQEQNLLRQYDLLSNCVDIGLEKGIEAFDKYTLWALNYVSVANIAQFGGRYREEPIYVGNHNPPHFREVPDLMDRFFSLIHENWTIVEVELDPPVCGGKRTHSSGGLLLSDMPKTREALDWCKDRARANPGEPPALLCCITRSGTRLGMRDITMLRNCQHTSRACSSYS